MKRAAAAAILLAVGAGITTYFVLRGPSAPQVPKPERSAILEEATERGIIRGYRVVTFNRHTGFREYVALGGEIRLRFPGACGAMACPASLGSPRLFLDYRHTVSTQAEEIRSIAKARYPHTKIIFGPPYYP